jgi:peptidyl-prolyl cis-trans isomerase D
VEASIRQRVTQEEATKLARKEGEAKLAAAKVSGSADGFSPAQLVSRAEGKGLSPQALGEIMKADTAKLPAYVGVEVPGMGYSVYRIGKVQQPATPDAARRKSEEEQIANVIAQQEMFDYVAALKQKAKVKLLSGAVVAKPDEAK